MIPLISACILAAILSLTACQDTRLTPPTPSPPPQDAGWQLFPTPRTGDGPGRIFSIDSNHVMHRELMLSMGPPLKTDTQDIYLPTVDYSDEWKPDFLMTYLGDSINVGGEDKVAVHLQFDDVALQSRDWQSELLPALRSVTIAFEPRSRYFLVEAVRSASAVDLSYKTHSSSSESLTAVIDKLFQVKPVNSADGTRSWILHDSFKHGPMNVMYKVREILPTGMGAGPSSDFTVSERPVTERLTWTSEENDN